MRFDYYVEANGEEVLALRDVSLSFMQNSPVRSSYPAMSMYSEIISIDNMNEYDGYFSMSINPFFDNCSEELDTLFKTLISCEKAAQKITIKIKPSEEAEANFAVILNNANIYHVGKMTRTNKDNEFSSMVYMLYKN